MKLKIMEGDGGKMKLELKPCPFCGEKRQKMIINKTLMGEYRVEHFCVFTILSRKFHRKIEDAIDEWNSRANKEKN